MGFTRRFWQYSTDHRGTIQRPGLVLTLISDEEIKYLKQHNEFEQFDFGPHGIVYGKAFKIRKDKIESTLDYLDFREKGRYERIVVDIYSGTETVKGLLYTANL